MTPPAKTSRASGGRLLRVWQAAVLIVASSWLVPSPYGRWIAAACLLLCAAALLASVLRRRPARPPAQETLRSKPEAETETLPDSGPSVRETVPKPAAAPAPAPVVPPVTASAPTWDKHTGNDKIFHVIATRHGIGVFDEHWFEYRQHLFENITVPSLDAQTEQDFIWLIAIDRDMPERARKRLDELAADRPYIRLLELELKADFKEAAARWANKKAQKRRADWVMTTRLDDDDAVSTGLVARLRQEAAEFVRRGERRPALFAPVIGFNWVPVEMSGHRTFRPGPSIGLSLLVPADERRTVYDDNHMKINRRMAAAGAYVKCIDDDALWWLYAVTSVSDQQREGSDRRALAYANPDAYRIDAAFLSRFGITAESAELLRSVPEPEPVESTYYLTSRGNDVEQQIIALRSTLRKGECSEEEAAAAEIRIAELHAVRRSMHEGLIKPRTAQESRTAGTPAVR